MGYVPPSLDELPLPTPEEFTANPNCYWGKLEGYKKKHPLVAFFVRQLKKKAREK